MGFPLEREIGEKVDSLVLLPVVAKRGALWLGLALPSLYPSLASNSLGRDKTAGHKEETLSYKVWFPSSRCHQSASNLTQQPR